MAKNNNVTDFCTDLSNAVREKMGTRAKIRPLSVPEIISSIQTGRPTLNRPTIRLSGSTLTITDTSNGDFTTTYRVYRSGVLSFISTTKTIDLSEHYGADTTNVITVSAYNSRVNESAKSTSVTYAPSSEGHTVSLMIHDQTMPVATTTQTAYIALNSDYADAAAYTYKVVSDVGNNRILVYNRNNVVIKSFTSSSSSMYIAQNVRNVTAIAYSGFYNQRFINTSSGSTSSMTGDYKILEEDGTAVFAIRVGGDW